tara:strand:- start:82 stop:261 length:180 start_codon:yes stop_codon:yes gene_type:complete
MDSSDLKLKFDIELDTEDLNPLALDFRAVALKTMKFILKELQKQDQEDKIIQDLFTRKK